jgi:protease PrsW
MNLDTLIYASLGGIVPALLWLWFWLREDKRNPEPKKLILKTFLLGMLAVLLVLPFQKGTDMMFPGMGIIAIFLWATFEELFKLFAGWFGGIRSKEDDEPIDPMIYMVTAALGFVALENTLFVLGPLVGENIPRGIMTANMRFIGASLLHVVASGIIGLALTQTFYSKPSEKWAALAFSFVLAVVFHTGFNFLIIYFGDIGMLLAFLAVWSGVIFLLWYFEKAKSIARRQY